VAKSEAKLIIQEPSIELQASPKNLEDSPEAASIKSTITNTEQRPGLGSLRKIRQQVSEQNKSCFNEAKPIDEGELHKAWKLFVEQLKSRNNHSAVTVFKAAELRLIDNNAIEITTSSEIQKAFIETERAPLIEYIQTYFNNRTLTYQVIVVEKDLEEKPQEVVLSRKQQYLKIIEEYPLIKELKERLKLEIE
jgi:DNA polymerase III subunit gamma/tau